MDNFHPSRLTLARLSFGWTKTKLATEVGLTPKRIADYENRGDTPPLETLTALAEALKVPVEFFSNVDPGTPTNISFRSFSSMTASVRDMAIASAQMTMDVGNWIGQRIELQVPSLPTDLAGVNPELAANVLRQQWGLGSQPAPNLIHLAELMGVRVFALAVSARTLDAFSFWDRELPYVLINARGTAERRRWDVAHEIGHLLLHAGAHHLPSDRGREDEADRFASALLLPTDGIRRDAIRIRSLEEVREHKVRWGVSALAMIRCLHRNGYVTDWEYRNLAIEANKAKLRRFEDDIPAETSPVLTMVLSELRKRQLGPRTIATELQLRPGDVRNMFHSLAPVEVAGSIQPVSNRPRKRPTRPQLRLVQ